MTASQGSRPLAPLPIRLRPQRAETAESYARRLARANHLRPSYLRAFLCDPPRRTGVIRPWRLAAISGRSVRALEHALADLTQGSPPRRQPRAPGSVRTLISTLEAYRFRRHLYYAICAILVSTPSSYSEGVRYPSPFCIL